jgi:tricorn protease
MKKMDGKSEKLENISYSAEMRQDLTKEREYLLQNVYQSEKTRFYNTNMHGIDWDSMVNDYKKFLPHIDNNYDFAEMLSELLGELNVSHTGGRYSPRGNAGDDSTANLGLLFDMTWEKAGMKVDEILAGGPFDRASSKLKAGNIIEKINGEEITANTDIAKLMNGISRKKTLVSIYDPSTNRRWDEVILPITSGQVNSLLYDRWVKKNAEKVDKLSNGRLGYVHLQSMSDASFRQAYSDMLGKYNLKDGVIIDTRWNGGGRLDEDIEILVSGHKYLTQVDRGEETCDMPSRRWNKPTIMITCEANYSNAHGTPWVYQHQKLGKVVGAPVPGTMTTVNWVTTQDPTLVYGIPIIGYLQENGQYLENTQLEPDILILNDPSKVVEGEDAQLETSVKELLKQIDNK